MIFRRIIVSAVLVGLCAGLLLTFAQNFKLLPLILKAEQHEVPESSAARNIDQNANVHAENRPTIQAKHDHDESWSPKEGAERLAYTLGANILAAIGLSTLLISLMSLSGKRVSVRAGLLWGLAGFSAFYVSPSLGLSPELPGMQAADLEQRQLWWISTVLSTAVGLACIAFATKYYKVLGVVFLAIPHIVGAPTHPGEAKFSHPDANIVVTLESLHSQFLQHASMVNLGYWILLGLLSALLVQKYVRPFTVAPHGHSL